MLTHARGEGGFTLIEMLVTLSILMIVVSAFAMVFQTTITRSATLTEHATLEAEGRSVVDTIANELRQAACYDSTTPPVVAGSGSSVTFYTPDRATPYHLREVKYTLASGTLSEQQVLSTNTTGPPWTLPVIGTAASITKVGSVSNSIVFDFADVTGADLSVNGAAVSGANLDNIAYVTIQVDLLPKASHGVQPVHVQETVTVRSAGAC
ncbi:MAG TPA: prepilin-type N-terminal cleavage/methylation domain-containing protein [Gaiellaceae bacterium]